MSEKVTPGRPWELILSRPYLAEMSGEFRDQDKRAMWCIATFEGGNTLRLWNEAVELKIALLASCALRKGQHIALVGKYTTESGILPVLKSLIGQEGSLFSVEILPEVMDAFKNARTASGTKLQWDFHYLDSLPDSSLDRVILFGAASHVKNWTAWAQQISRVLRDEGRIIIADIPPGSREMIDAARMDAHLYGVLAVVLDGMGIAEEELPAIGPEDMESVFEPYLDWSRAFSWHGMYLFYGQKGGGDRNPSGEFPQSTGDVQAFLTVKPRVSPWDFLSPADTEALGSEVADAGTQKKFWRFASFGAGLDWLYPKYDDIVRLMYRNLRAEPGYRVLVIGEVLENLGFLPALRQRTGARGEIAAFEMSEKHLSIFQRLWRGADIPVSERHQWDYPYADEYPDNHFDLVWLPQGVHHARDWKDIAPRLLRVLKPGGQVMMLECRFCPPGFHTAINASGLLKCMAEKLWWAMGVTFEEMPDYTTAQIAEAFNDSLTDTFGLDTHGWLLFWGYKK